MPWSFLVDNFPLCGRGHVYFTYLVISIKIIKAQNAIVFCILPECFIDTTVCKIFDKLGVIVHNTIDVELR